VVDSEDEDDTCVGASSAKQAQNETSMTVVLIDEVDVLFDSEGDAGFWAALSSLVKTAKSPIILTANFCPSQLRNNNNLSSLSFELERPAPIECATKLLQICRQEGIRVNSRIRELGPDRIHEKLSSLASACHCDLRKMIHELQVFASGPTFSRCTKAMPLEAKAEGKTPYPPEECSDWKPMIYSLTPDKIPMEKYSVVTVKGKKFGAFGALISENEQDEIGEFSVWIGEERCRTRVVDDETMLVLCPPHPMWKEDDCFTFCSRLLKRVVPFWIECPSLGLYRTWTRLVDRESAMDAVCLCGTRWLTIEYEVPDECVLQRTNEWEFGIEDQEIKCEETGKEACKERGIQGIHDGLSVWKNALSKVETHVDALGSTGSKTANQAHLNTAEELQICAIDAKNSSDAALLGDFIDGLPFLAGACKGFGFEYTEDCVGQLTQGDKLRLHEKSRPPREEKLFSLGWKDSCYFYGDPETYVTQPSMSVGKSMNYHLQNFRANESIVADFVFASDGARDPDEIESREDLDRNAHLECQISEVDCFLPYQTPAVLQMLPSTLSSCLNMSPPSKPFLETRKLEFRNRFENQVNYILPAVTGRALWSYGRYGYANHRERMTLVLELLPTLRRIAVYEQAAEYAALRMGEDAIANSNRRTTRQQAKARRRHYFDRLSETLRGDEADLNFSEVGSLIAKDLLAY